MTKKQEDQIVTEISHCFATFGGGRRNDYNPLAQMLIDRPVMFAMGVDVRNVVRFVSAHFRPKPKPRRKASR